MDKRGQLYIIAALIIGFIIFIVITPVNIVKQAEPEDNFQEIGKNFETESAKFLNRLIESDSNIERAFLNFTVLFTSYAKTKNPDFGLLFLFIYNDKLYVGNYLHDRIIVNYQGSHPLNGCFSQIKAEFAVAGLTLNVPNLNLNLVQNCLLAINAVTNNRVGIEIIEPNNTRVDFRIDVVKGNPDVVIVAKEKKGNTRRIFTKGRFL